MVQHINALLGRQIELRNLHEQDDAKYEKNSRHKAHETIDQSEAEAIKTLSKFGYEKYWLEVVEQGKQYSHWELASGASSVHRNETRNESARIIQPGKRCTCERYLAFESMCEHEYAIRGKFDKDLFSESLFQPCQLEERVEIVSNTDHNNFTQDVEDDGVAIHNDDDDDDNITLADLGRKRPGECPEGGSRIEI
jgi:hypothetical protein